MDLILSSLSQGLLWSIMAIGVYLTYRILDIADLTAEGAYPLGAAICATGIVSGVNPLVATLLAFVGGMGAGLVSGLLHTKMKIPALLTGIVTLTGLYSINLKVLGKANVALLRQTTLVTQLQDLGLTKTYAVLVIGGIFVLVVIALLTLLLKTQVGLALRSTGDNIPMSEANGINVDQMKIYGYMLSNGLIALCGALLTQNNGYADLNSGTGTIVIGLASVIIAEVILRNLSISRSWFYPLPHDHLGYPGDSWYGCGFGQTLLSHFAGGGLVCARGSEKNQNPSFSWYGQKSLGGQDDDYFINPIDS